MPPRTREIKVGLLILAAFAVLAAGVFLIGEKNNLFSRKNRYFIEFNSAGGVRQGNPVQLNGVDAGTVEQVVLPQDPAKEQIRIWISVDRQYAERIRGPQQPGVRGEKPRSQARIKTLGLLGDKYIELSSGSLEYPVIPDQGKIPAAEPTNVDALIASGEDVMDNVVEISASLSTILGRMERGEGVLGELTTQSESGRRLRDSLIGTSESLERIAARLETGEGPLPRLLNDRQMADQLASSLDRFEGLLAQAQNGPGLLPGLLNDPAMRQQVTDTLATLQQTARDLQGLTADLESGNGLLPRLMKDEEYAREITGKVSEIVTRLNELSLKVSEGNGSAAKLINDPQIYDAVNDVIIGVNESRLLRWLIRSRQKKGIERRYKDTKKAMEEQGITPPPLDKQPEAPDAPQAEETPPPPAEPPNEPPPLPGRWKGVAGEGVGG